MSSLADSPKKGKVVGWVDGCFDMMHHGHANAIRQAKEHCDYLIVGVHNDADVELNKGPPVMPEEARYAAVRACKWVDQVVEDAPYVTSIEWMDRYGATVCLHGDDITTDADGRDAYYLVKAAGRYKEFKRTAGVSTTDLVGRMLLCSKKHHSRSRTNSTGLEAMGEGTKDVKKFASPYTGVSDFVPSTNQILQFARGARDATEDDTIVYIDGAWDLFHAGHINLLKRAKEELGTYLIVGVFTDASVNKYRGANHPIMNLHERVLSLLSCRYVDQVIIGAPLVCSRDFLEQLKVDVVATGRLSSPVEYTEDIEFYADAKAMGIHREIESHSDVTTTWILDRIWKNRMAFYERNRKKQEKEMARLASFDERKAEDEAAAEAVLKGKAPQE